MKKCHNCRHYRTEKNWYSSSSYPCDTCFDEEINFEPYPEGKMTFDPRKKTANGVVLSPERYRNLAKNISKYIKSGRFLIS